jgi:hypothetical protein
MTRDETDPMPRFLLALCLYAVAAVALAGPPAGSDDTAGKPAKPAATTATTDQDSAAASTPAPAPSRSGATTRPSAKRWHSLLPGMIR